MLSNYYSLSNESEYKSKYKMHIRALKLLFIRF